MPVRFEDYSDVELAQILSAECRKLELDVPLPVKRHAIKKLAKLRSLPNFGNAGAVQTMLADAKGRMAVRVQVRLPPPPHMQLEVAPRHMLNSQVLHHCAPPYRSCDYCSPPPPPRLVLFPFDTQSKGGSSRSLTKPKLQVEDFEVDGGAGALLHPLDALNSLHGLTDLRKRLEAIGQTTKVKLREGRSTEGTLSNMVFTGAARGWGGGQCCPIPQGVAYKAATAGLFTSCKGECCSHGHTCIVAGRLAAA
jgi:hypothetical protein